MSWLSGETTTREVDGVTLTLKVFPAREMLDLLETSQTIEDDFGGESLSILKAAILKGCAGWKGDGAPAYGEDGLDLMPLPALQRIFHEIVKVNTLTEEQKGNSLAS